MPTDLELLGGEERLQEIIDRFIDLVFDDLMIGFLFRGADRQRIKDKERELAAAHLGGPARYSGKPLAAAHAPHAIMGGHFDRRLKLLEETLDAFAVPTPVRERWLAHNQALRRTITGDRPGQCRPPLA